MSFFSGVVSGRIANEAKVFWSNDKSKGLSFSIAYDTYDNKTKENVTSFVDVTAFVGFGFKEAEWLAKGAQVCVNGGMVQKQYQTTDGLKSTNWVFEATTVVPTFAAKATVGAPAATAQTTPAAATTTAPENIPEIDINEDEIPF